MRDERNVEATLELQRPVAKDSLQDAALTRFHRLHLVEGVLPHVFLHEEPLAHPDDPVIRHDDVRRGLAEEHEEEPVVGDEEERERCNVGDVGEPRGVVRRDAREREEEQAHREQHAVHEDREDILDPVLAQDADESFAVGGRRRRHVRGCAAARGTGRA